MPNEQVASRRAPLLAGVLVLAALAGWMLWPRSSPAPGRDREVSSPEASPPARDAPPRVAGPVREPAGAAPDPGANGSAASEVPARLFARLKLSAEEDRLLWEAEEAAVAACMRERGFEYAPNPFGGDDPGGAEPAAPRPGDLAAARARGFGIAASIEAVPAPAPDVNRPRVEAMEPAAQRAWLEALAGRPIEPTGPADRPGLGTVSIPGGPMVQWDRGACLAHAERSLHGDDLRHTEQVTMINFLREQVALTAREDAEVRAGVERWRGCMGARGWSYPEPGAAAHALAEEYEAGRLTLDGLREREIAVATAEASCHQEAGLAALHERARARAEAKLEREHRALLESYVAAQADALARASRVASR